MGVPFIPTLGYAGSDVIRERDDFTMAPNPFDPTEMVVMAKAITPDVALFHGSKGDSRGNVLVSKGGEALMLAQASDKVVVTVEEIVDSCLVRTIQRGLSSLQSTSRPWLTLLLGPTPARVRDITVWTWMR